MTSFHLTGIQNATIAKDRTKFEINLRSNKGPLALTLSAEHLGNLITCLHGLEYHASLLNPTTGQLPGEQGQIRAEIVDHHQIGNGVVNGIPSVFLGLKSGPVFRWFALDATKATAALQALEVEIPKLQSAPESH